MKIQILSEIDNVEEIQVGSYVTVLIYEDGTSGALPTGTKILSVKEVKDEGLD